MATHLVCLKCAKVPGVQPLSSAEPNGQCESCGLETLDTRVSLDDRDFELVQPLDTACERCRKPWRVFPHELHHVARKITPWLTEEATLRCPNCRHERKFPLFPPPGVRLKPATK